MLAADGGLGLQSLIDFTHKAKLRLLLRNIEKEDDTGRAFQGLIARALRDAGTGGMRANQTIGSSLTEPNWVTSLVTWLSKIGLCIEVQGPSPSDEPSKFIADDLPVRHSLYARGVALQGENDLDTNYTPIPLRAGQCWGLRGKVYEIIGFSGDSAECLEWSPPSLPLQVGSALTVDNRDDFFLYAKGLGSDCKINISDLSRSRELVERTKDTIESFHSISEEGNNLSIVKTERLHSKIVGIRNRIPQCVSSTHTPELLELEKIRRLHCHAIYTDGSRSTRNTISSLLLGSGETATNGAIVLHTNRGMVTIKVEMDVETKSAYDPEVVSLLIAHEIAGDRKIPIWSDCSAAIKCLNGGGLGAYAQVLSGWKKNKSVTFRKVKAHPENSKLPEDWTTEDKGNYMADSIAGGIVTPMLSYSASNWLKHIGKRSKVIIAKLDGTPLVLEPREIKSKIDTSNYLKDRDEYREAASKPACWEGANLALHHKLMGRSRRIGDRVITQRIGLLKRWQWHSARKDNICSGCDSPITDVSHPLRTCSNGEMVAARADWWREVDSAIMKSNKAMHGTLFYITRKMREAPGGEIACCGAFQRGFVDSLQCEHGLISDNQSKTIIRVLKKVVGGARKILRLAAEVQLGLAGINWRQSTITQFYKPKVQSVKQSHRRDWSDKPSVDTSENRIKKDKSYNHIIAMKNRDLSVNHFFESYTSIDNTVYWLY
jgi:hypothetical protein